MSQSTFDSVNEGPRERLKPHLNVVLCRTIVLGKPAPSFLKSLLVEDQGPVIYVFNFVQLGEIKDIQKSV